MQHHFYLNSFHKDLQHNNQLQNFAISIVKYSVRSCSLKDLGVWVLNKFLAVQLPNCVNCMRAMISTFYLVFYKRSRLSSPFVLPSSLFEFVLSFYVCCYYMSTKFRIHVQSNGITEAEPTALKWFIFINFGKPLCTFLQILLSPSIYVMLQMTTIIKQCTECWLPVEKLHRNQWHPMW